MIFISIIFSLLSFWKSAAVAAAFEGGWHQKFISCNKRSFQTFYWKRKNRELSKIKVFVTHNKSFYDPQNIALFSSGKE